MARHLPAIIVVLTLSAGCLLKDTTATWYLNANGTVAWIVTESDVRSDAQATVDRQNEEDTYRLALERRDQPVARGFRALGFTDVRTVVLRREVPFAVRTEARGMAIDGLGLRILQRSGLAGNSTLVRDGNRYIWSFTARDPHAPDVTTPMDDDLSAILGDLDQLKVVITDSRFETANGFELSSDHRVATMKDSTGRDGAQGADDTSITLRLVWVAVATSSPSRPH